MIEDDPNAVFVDNLLPNGQYLLYSEYAAFAG